MKVISFKAPEEDHERWKEQALDAGVSFGEWVRRKLNAIHVGDVVRITETREVIDSSAAVKAIKAAIPQPTQKVKPKDCVNRVPKGSFCKQCGSIHK